MDTILQHGLNLEEDPDKQVADLSASIKELSYPYTPQEPQLSDSEPHRLDSIAEHVEIECLFGLPVLLTDDLPPDAKIFEHKICKVLDRGKRDGSGSLICLKRSRLVASAWAPTRPRSFVFTGFIKHCNKNPSHLLLVMEGAHGCLMLAIDVKDVFLTVEQEQPTRVRCTNAAGVTITYSLGRVPPGQRDGSLLWSESLVKFLSESSWKMTEHEVYPSLLCSAKGDCLILVHIDDILIVGSRKTVLEELTPDLEANYTISIKIIPGPGDEVTFLKRTHQLLDWSDDHQDPS